MRSTRHKQSSSIGITGYQSRFGASLTHLGEKNSERIGSGELLHRRSIVIIGSLLSLFAPKYLSPGNSHLRQIGNGQLHLLLVVGTVRSLNLFDLRRLLRGSSSLRQIGSGRPRRLLVVG